MKSRILSCVVSVIVTSGLLVLITSHASAQDKRVIRIAKIQVDPAQLDSYNAALKEQIQAAVRIEPGVVMLYAVHDRKIPTNVTVFEIYADTAAYHSHIQTAHFRKYKATTTKMVTALELTDVTAIELAQKK